jgi:valyl-tRNA synthetase
MGLIVNNAPGTDMNLDPDKVNAYKKFANKLWNITRFVLTSSKGYDVKAPLTSEDAQNITENLSKGVNEITTYMENDRYDLASERIYHFVWTYFADELIEASKLLLGSEDATVSSSRKRLLVEYLVTSLKLLHPYMPFITETIWQELPKEMRDSEILMVAKWPIN